MKSITKNIQLIILMNLVFMPLVIAQFAGGSGTEVSPYQITSPTHLNEVRNYLSSHFILMNNIDLDDTDYDEANGGWSNIGNGGTPFTGVFDGNSKTINGVFIDKPNESYKGLFAYTTGTIKDLNLTDLSITGFNYVGGLTALNEGVITNVTVSGFISGLAIVGGLVGRNSADGSIASSSTNITIISHYDTIQDKYDDGFDKGGLVGHNRGNISDSHSSGSVSEGENGGSTGGLVGYARDDMYIINSYSTAVVTGTNDVGGLIGRSSDGSVSNVYATGNITGANKIGGLVGNAFSTDITGSYASGAVDGDNNVGGLVGEAGYLLIHNSHATGNVIASVNVGGGLVGNSGHSEITNSYASGSVLGGNVVGGLVGVNNYQSDISGSKATGNVSGVHKVGGLIGEQYYDANIEVNYSTGDVSGSTSVGGFIGEITLSDNEIENNYSTSTVTGTSEIGGFIGVISDDDNSITNNYGAGSVTGNTNVGGFIGDDSGTNTITTSYWNITTSGQASSDGGTGLTNSEFLNPESYLGFNFSFVWDSVETIGYSSPFLQNNTQSPKPSYVISRNGNGSNGDPFQISTYEQLEFVNNLVSSSFVLTSDIDASESSTANDGAGFKPIGSESDPYTGHFDGDGFTINNLTINRPSKDSVGFFGSLDGEVSNLILSNVDIKGKGYTGGLAGYGHQNSVIANVGVIGSISASTNFGSGGLVGVSEGDIHDCFADVSVEGWNLVGGLIGLHALGTVENCYAKGSVSGNSDIGGLVGQVFGSTISNVYSTAKVSGVSVGGLIADENFSSVDGFWNRETSGQNSSDGGTGLTTANMFDASNFTGFDFENTWDMYEGYSFPLLRDVNNALNSRIQLSGVEGWRLMSSPQKNITIATLLDTLWIQGFTGADKSNGTSNVYIWDEPSQGFQSVTNASNILAPGTGLLVYVYDDQDGDGNANGFPKTLWIDGLQMKGNTNFSLNYTNTGASGTSGWNLIGNPYAFDLDWDAASGISSTNMDASFYVWSGSANNGNGAYLSWNGTTGTLDNGIISPWQGFWVKANAVSPSLSFTEEIRSNGGVSPKKLPVSEMRFTLSRNDLTSTTIVMFSEQASIQKDVLDAYKLASINSDYLSVFTRLDNGEALDINGLPSSLNEVLEIDLDYLAKVNDSSSIPLTLKWNLKSLPDDWSFALIDNDSKEEINLREQQDVSFELTRQPKSKEINTDDLESPRHGIIAPSIVKAKSQDSSRFTLRIAPVGVSVSNEPDSDLPTEIELQQNYPNPFNPSTTIAYGVPQTGKVTLEVFDVLGRKVATLLNSENKTAGRYTVNFNASNLASGMYIYKLRTGNTVITKKLTLIK